MLTIALSHGKQSCTAAAAATAQNVLDFKLKSYPGFNALSQNAKNVLLLMLNPAEAQVVQEHLPHTYSRITTGPEAGELLSVHGLCTMLAAILLLLELHQC